MKKSLATLLTALILFSCAMAETGGLDLNREVKPATAFTAQANAAVTCIAAPSPVPQSSPAAAPLSDSERIPQTLPSGCG